MDTKVKNCFYVSDISEAMKEMRSVGVALISGMLKELFRSSLFDETSGLPFKKATEKVGVVNQSFDYCAFLNEIPDRPHLETLRRATEELVQKTGDALFDESLQRWFALDVVVNRYGKNGGLGAHKDLKRHPGVIAIWNIAGSCDFEMLNDRNGEILAVYRPNPGDLILLRGTMPCDGLGDQRPFHRVSNIGGVGPRISVTVRHNTNPGNPIAGFSYLNA